MKRSDLPWLAGAIVSGGVVSPVLLMIGLSTTQATTGSLLLNLEGVFTALLAWFAFTEQTDRRIVLGMIAVILGSLLLSWTPGRTVTFSFGSLAIVAACFCWALDNNLTRKISEADSVQIAAWKGLAGGAVNCLIAAISGDVVPPLTVALSAAAIGVLGYGISLSLFIKSLRLLGTARTAAYFSTAPFAGAILSLALLHEPVTPNLLIAGGLMLVGVWLHLSEKHEHVHVHPAIEHEHEHVHFHDEHHEHEHRPNDPLGEPHSHPHQHQELKHAHPHYPDTEHRHEH